MPETLAEAVVEARDLLDRASTRAHPGQLREAAERFEALARRHAESVWARYHAGYARYRMAALQQGDRKAAVGHLTVAVEHLKEAARMDARNAEARALLSTCHGMQLRYAPYKGPWLGNQKWRAMAEAEALEPRNPRVVLLRGLQRWTTPALVGGDKEEAFVRFGEAVECFEGWTPTDEQGPVWGHAQAWAFLGLAHLHRGDEERGREALEAALRISPDYHWVRNVLLPRVGIVAA